MSEDDATCPECGEPVSATASYCMHCYADLPWAEEGAEPPGTDDGGGVTDAVTDALGDAVGDDPAADDGTAAGGTVDSGVTDSAATTATDATAGAGAADETVAGGTGTGTGDIADGTTTGDEGTGATDAADDDGLLDPEGMVDNTLTVAVAIAGSIVIGLVGTFVMLFLTASLWALPLGLLAWLVSLAYLARQYSVQATIGKTFYGVAIVLLSFPLIAVSPAMNAGLGDRAAFFVATLVGMAFPAVIAAGIGFVVLRFAPEPD